jgi:hypothetical protein
MCVCMCVCVSVCVSVCVCDSFTQPGTAAQAAAPLAEFGPGRVFHDPWHPLGWCPCSAGPGVGCFTSWARDEGVTHTPTHTDTHTHTHTHTDTHRHTQTHTHRHTQTHTDTHTYTHIHTYIHTLTPVLSRYRKHNDLMNHNLAPMALRIRLLMSSALQHDMLDVPLFCSAELLRRSILRAIGCHFTFA